MLFNSFIFLFFLSIVVPAYYLVPKRYKHVLLLAASYFFYGYWDWRFLSLIWISTLVDFLVGRAIYQTQDKSRRKGLLFISLIVNLGLLVCFKYFNFFIDSFSQMISIFGHELDFLHIHLILPVGISFYTFQTLSYTIDIYRGKLEPTNSFLNFALFVSFFPQLVAGPIERASKLLPQLEKHRRFDRKNLMEGIYLISIGMFKKVLIGDTCGRITDHIFANPEIYYSLELIVGVVLFSLQIYSDFSGYSAIARGSAKLLGIDLMINFKQPYLSASITEFWHRWHISLSSWLKDYLYIPLGGNRKGKTRTYINLMLTMLLGGLWHGANWTFVTWGGLHGLYLIIHKLISHKQKPQPGYEPSHTKNMIPYLFKILGTNMLVLFAWLFFRADSWQTAVVFINRVLNWQTSDLSQQFISVCLSFLTISFIIDSIQYKTNDTLNLGKLNPAIKSGILLPLWFVILIYLFQAEHLPFIYFQF